MALDLQNIELLEAHRTEAEDLLIGQGSRHGCGEVDRLSCSISSAQYDEILGHLNGPDVGQAAAARARLFTACSRELLTWSYALMCDKDLVVLGCKFPASASKARASKNLSGLPPKHNVVSALMATTAPLLDLRVVAAAAILWSTGFVPSLSRTNEWKAKALPVYGASRMPPPPPRGPLPTHPAGPLPGGPPPGSLTPQVPAGTGPSPGSLPPQVPAGTSELAAVMMQLAKNNQLMFEQLQALKHPPKPDAAAHADGKARRVALATQAIQRGEFVDPSTISVEALQKAFQKGLNSSTANKLASFMGGTDQEDSLIKPHDGSWASILCGFNKMQDIWDSLGGEFSQCSKMLRAFLRQVESLTKANTDGEKVTYVRRFLMKYPDPRINQWDALASSDFPLVSEFLNAPMHLRLSTAGKHAASQAQGPAGLKPPNLKRKQANSSVAGAPKGGKGAIKGKGALKGKGGGKSGSPRYPGVCFSRSAVKIGACGAAICKFSHACVSCGADHDAATCAKAGTWDATLDSHP